jgi:thioredoxin 1
MAVQQVSEQDFEAQVLASEVPVLLEFGATWCGPCKTVEPELIALANELGGRARVLKVDIDQSPYLARQLGIQSVPTFMVFSQGRPVAGKVGALKKAQLMEMLQPVLPRPAGALQVKEVAQLRSRRQIALVDTRPALVFQRAHIQGAVSMPLETLPENVEQLLSLPAPPVLYCRTGADAKAAATSLAEQGAPVSYLEGGVLAWEAEGFELYRPD